MRRDMKHIHSRRSRVALSENVKESRDSRHIQSAEPRWVDQQAEWWTKNCSNSLPTETRVGFINRHEKVSRTAATHSLQSQGCFWSVGLKGCQRQQQATHSLQSQGWAQSAGLKGCRDSSNSLPAEPRVGLVCRCKRVTGTAATHSL